MDFGVPARLRKEGVSEWTCEWLKGSVDFNLTTGCHMHCDAEVKELRPSHNTELQMERVNGFEL